MLDSFCQRSSPLFESVIYVNFFVLQPPRDCHPVVKYQCKACEAMVIDNMPFDKYELEPSPLTQYILERKQPYVAWQVKSLNFRSSKRLQVNFFHRVIKYDSNTQVDLFLFFLDIY